MWISEDEKGKTTGGEEKYINYMEYIEKINTRAMEERKKRKLEMKEYWAKNPALKNEEEWVD